MIHLRQVQTLRGPNLWDQGPAFAFELDLTALDGRAVAELPAAFRTHLLDRLPAPRPHEPAAAEVAERLAVLRQGTAPAVSLPESLGRILLGLTGGNRLPSATEPGAEPGHYRVLLGFQDEALDRHCVETVWGWLNDALAPEGSPAAAKLAALDLEALFAALRQRANETRLGPSTRALVTAALDRDVPVRRLNTGSLVQLGWGARQRRIWTAQSDRTGSIAAEIASDKDLTRRLLLAAGVPTPAGRVVESPADAWLAAQEIGVPVVVKPRDSNHSQGVALDLTTQEQVEAAFPIAAAVRPNQPTEVMVERFVRGAEHRLLVVGPRMVAAYRGDRLQVEGDGVHSIRQLAEALNDDPRRGTDWYCTLDTVVLDDLARLVIAKQGYSIDDVPAAGVLVALHNASDQYTDVTDAVHPEVAARAVEAAQVVGLDIAGIDLIAQAIDRPLEEQGGAIVEVNAGPGLFFHLHPHHGQGRPVARAILEELFPPGADGRIPLIAVTGARHATTVAQALAQALPAALGLSPEAVGLATAEGTFRGGRRVRAGGGVEVVRDLLLHPGLALAVLALEPTGVRAEGLPFDRPGAVLVTDAAVGSDPLPLAVARLVLGTLRPGDPVLIGPGVQLPTAFPPTHRLDGAPQALAHHAATLLARQWPALAAIALPAER